MSDADSPLTGSLFDGANRRRRVANGRSVRSFFSLGAIATAFFVIADYIPFYHRWSTVQTEDWFFVALLSFASALILDLPMFLAGRAIREYQSGLRTRNEAVLVTVLAAVAFFTAYAPFVYFSYTTKDAVFEEALPLRSAATVSFDDFAAETEEAASNPASVTAAMLLSTVMPLGTSLASLTLTLVTYRPLEERIENLRRARELAEEHRSRLRDDINRNAGRADRLPLMTAHQRDLYDSFVREVYAQEQVRIQASETAQEEPQDTEGVLRTTDRAFHHLNNSDFTDTLETRTEQHLTDPPPVEDREALEPAPQETTEQEDYQEEAA